MKPKAMTSLKERLWAAINLQACDRVPVGFCLSWFAATNAGISKADFTNDSEANFTAAKNCSMTWADWISSRCLASLRP